MNIQKSNSKAKLLSTVLADLEKKSSSQCLTYYIEKSENHFKSVDFSLPVKVVNNLDLM